MAGRSARLQNALAHDCFTLALVRQQVKGQRQGIRHPSRASLIIFSRRTQKLRQGAEKKAKTTASQERPTWSSERIQESFRCITGRCPLLLKVASPKVSRSRDTRPNNGWLHVAPTSIVLTSRDDELDMPTRALSTLSMWLYGSETQVRLNRPCSRGRAVVRVGAHVCQDRDVEKKGMDSSYPF